MQTAEHKLLPLSEPFSSFHAVQTPCFHTRIGHTILNSVPKFTNWLNIKSDSEKKKGREGYHDWIWFSARHARSVIVPIRKS